MRIALIVQEAYEWQCGSMLVIAVLTQINTYSFGQGPVAWLIEAHHFVAEFGRQVNLIAAIKIWPPERDFRWQPKRLENSRRPHI